MVNIEKGYHYTQCGLDNIWLLNGYEVKETPYGKALSIDNVDGLHQAITKALIDKPVRLTGSELRFLRVELDLSQKAFAGYFGKTDQSAANWEKTDKIPQEVDYLARHIIRQTLNEKAAYVDEVKRLQAFDQEDYSNWLSFQESEKGWKKAI